MRPVLPLYLPGEPIELDLQWNSGAKEEATVSISVAGENQLLDYETAPTPLPVSKPLLYPAPKGKGFHIITAELRVHGKPRAIYHSAFWIRDEDSWRAQRLHLPSFPGLIPVGMKVVAYPWSDCRENGRNA